MNREEEKEKKDIADPEKDKKKQETRKKIANISGRIIALSGILCITGGFVIISYQFYYWLKAGKWLAMPFSVIVSKVISINLIHHLEWKGISRLLIWITHQSSFLVLVILGCIVAVIGDIMYVRASKDYSESPLKKKQHRNGVRSRRGT